MTREICATVWKVFHYWLDTLIVGVVGGLVGWALNLLALPNGMPTWGWAFIAGVALIVAPFHAYHDARMELASYRPSVTFDAPAHWAYEWIAEHSEWGNGKEPLEIAKIMHQRARDGVLYVWGQPHTSSFSDEDRPLELIEPDYWRDYRFENTRLIFLEGKAITDSIGNPQTLRLYQSLHINRQQVKSIWHGRRFLGFLERFKCGPKVNTSPSKNPANSGS